MNTSTETTCLSLYYLAIRDLTWTRFSSAKTSLTTTLAK